MWNQPQTLQKLTRKLAYLERELKTVRAELEQASKQQVRDQENDYSYFDRSDLWSEKLAIQEEMAQLFVSLSIKGNPKGALAVQEDAAQAGLEINELSQAIIAARME